MIRLIGCVDSRIEQMDIIILSSCRATCGGLQSQLEVSNHAPGPWLIAPRKWNGDIPQCHNPCDEQVSLGSLGRFRVASVLHAVFRGGM